MGQLAVGIIGLGVGARYIQAVLNCPITSLVAVCDFDEKKLQDFSSIHPGIRTTFDATELINDPNIDVVMIASYDEYHFEQVMQSIKSGKNVFVEKPLCLNIEQAIEIKKALGQKPHLKLSSNMALRSCPKFQNVRDRILKEEIGRIYHLEADYLWGRLHKLLNGWRRDSDFYSIIYGASVHMLDLVLWLMNKKPVEVVGMGNNLVTENTGFKYNDFSVILLKFEDGSTAKVASHGGCVHPHFHKLSVFGEKQTFSHDLAASYWLNDSNPESHISHDNFEYPAKIKRGELLHSFFNSIIDPDGGGLVSTQDVFDTMSVCFAAQKATELNRIEKITYI